MAKGPAMPQVPDPIKTAAAQTGSNITTAQAQQTLNQTNQVTPYGNLTYTQSGTQKVFDPSTGKSYDIPSYTATTTLSPEQQKLYEQQSALGSAQNDLALNQIGKLTDLLGQPVNLSNEATESRLMELGRARLDPVLAQRRTALESRLANSGIRPGSDAYDRAMNQLNQGENDAYNQLLLSGRGQSVQEALAARNQPINEITALMSGGQVSQPNFVGTPQAGIEGTDIAGLTMAKYNADLNAYNAAQQQRQAMWGGLASLGGTLLGGWALSDKRAKQDIKKVGKLDDGTKVYAYRYKEGGGLMHLGVMAQEVEKTHPEAVATGDDGMKRVNYSRIAEALEAA